MNHQVGGGESNVLAAVLAVLDCAPSPSRQAALHELQSDCLCCNHCLNVGCVLWGASGLVACKTLARAAVAGSARDMCAC
jgi:hypothetical protein